MPLLLGIDLGTTGCKAAVYDEQGTCLGESYLEYGLITLSARLIEQDPLAWWQLTCRAIQLALAGAAVDREAVRALAVSSQGISFVMVDEAGQPLGNAVNWLDTRAADECALILERYAAKRLFAITGKRAAPSYVLPKLLWLRARRPELWRAARRMLTGHDYLVHRLCGEYVTDHSLAAGTLLYDLSASEWCTELLQAFDISPDMLPRLHWAGSCVGTLRPQVATQLGLSRDTAVVVGGQDQKCAALGAGIQDGTATLSLGTAAAVSQLMERPSTDPAMRVPTFSFVQPGRWVLEGVIGTGAGSLRWYRDLLGGEASYDQLIEEASHIPPGADGVVFYPHLGGATSPHWQNNARATWHGMSLATGRAHLTRALLEGVAFQVRQNLTVTQQLAGPVQRLIVFGGGARSRLWGEIIGDAANLPLARTPNVETASLGAAMLAGLGSGLFPSLAEARRAMVKVSQPRPPDPENARVYEQKYGEYCRLERIFLESSVR
jgi:xylulokinase